MALNAKQQLFVAEYLVDQNGTQAYMRAYGRKDAKAAQVDASKLLLNPIVQSEVQKGLDKLKADAAKRAEEHGITKERWLKEVSSLAFCDITDVFMPNTEGKLTMTMAELKKSGFGHNIRKLKVMPNGKVEFELHPKLPALELVAKHFGWIKDQMELSGGLETVPAMDRTDLQAVFADPEAMKHARALALKLSKPKENKNGKV